MVAVKEAFLTTTEVVRNFLLPYGRIIEIGARVVSAIQTAYNEFGGFRRVVDTVRSFLVDQVIPVLQSVGATVIESVVSAFQEAYSFVEENVDIPYCGSCTRSSQRGC